MLVTQSCLTLCNPMARQAPLSIGFSSKNTGVGCHALLQGTFPTRHILTIIPSDDWTMIELNCTPRKSTHHSLFLRTNWPQVPPTQMWGHARAPPATSTPVVAGDVCAPPPSDPPLGHQRRHFWWSWRRWMEQYVAGGLSRDGGRAAGLWCSPGENQVSSWARTGCPLAGGLTTPRGRWANPAQLFGEGPLQAVLRAPLRDRRWLGNFSAFQSSFYIDILCICRMLQNGIVRVGAFNTMVMLISCSVFPFLHQRGLFKKKKGGRDFCS